MTIHFDVPNPITEFIRAQTVAGGFKSETEYLLDLVERDRVRAAKEEMEMDLLKSLDSGPGVVVTPEFWRQKREELQKRIDSGEFNHVAGHPDAGGDR
jgi:Arc/MetJ-type ribon-helix-helix transcriptional regulator